jgi:hypothetical protein
MVVQILSDRPMWGAEIEFTIALEPGAFWPKVQGKFSVQTAARFQPAPALMG